MKKLENKCMLITYSDSMGNNLKDLYQVLDRYFKDAVGGVHILPFFPSSGDRGFAPMDYHKVDEAFGDWSDVEKLADDYYLMFDYMINHISAHSAYYKDFLEKIAGLQNEIKALQSENESLKSKLAKDALGDVMDQVCEVNGVKFLPAKVEGVDMNGLRDLGDQLREKIGEGVVLIASVTDGKVSLMAAVTDGAMKQGAHAGNLIKGIAALVGGGGGGRPNMAQAGGKNPAGVDAALEKAKEVLAGQIK